MASLYDLTTELIQLESRLDEWAQEHEGDITDFPMQDELDAIEGDIKEKCLNVAIYHKNLKSEADAIDAEIKALTARKRSASNKADRLKEYLRIAVKEGEKLSNSKCSIGWRKSEAVELSVAPETLPDIYQRVKVEADKTAIKSALKDGAVIDGARIVTNQNITIK